MEIVTEICKVRISKWDGYIGFCDLAVKSVPIWPRARFDAFRRCASGVGGGGGGAALLYGGVCIGTSAGLAVLFGDES